MAENKALPGFFRKREMLNGTRESKESLSRQGRDLVARGLLDEGLSFFLKAGDADGLEEVLEESRQQGDVFSFEAALRALGRTASRLEWKALGEKAFSTGKLRFAYRAYEKADEQEGLEQLRRVAAEEGVPTG